MAEGGCHSVPTLANTAFSFSCQKSRPPVLLPYGPQPRTRTVLGRDLAGNFTSETVRSDAMQAVVFLAQLL